MELSEAGIMQAIVVLVMMSTLGQAIAMMMLAEKVEEEAPVLIKGQNRKMVHLECLPWYLSRQYNSTENFC